MILEDLKRAAERDPDDKAARQRYEDMRRRSGLKPSPYQQIKAELSTLRAGYPPEARQCEYERILTYAMKMIESGKDPTFTLIRCLKASCDSVEAQQNTIDFYASRYREGYGGGS